MKLFFTKANDIFYTSSYYFGFNNFCSGNVVFMKRLNDAERVFDLLVRTIMLKNSLREIK
jgi:hypothetical protein